MHTTYRAMMIESHDFAFHNISIIALISALFLSFPNENEQHTHLISLTILHKIITHKKSQKLISILLRIITITGR